MRRSELARPFAIACCVLTAIVAADVVAQGRIIRVTTTEVQRKTVEQVETAVGIIESRRSPQVAAEVAGEVMRVLVEAGQGVEAGELIAELEDEQYQLEQAGNEAEAGRLTALLGKQQRELERARQLYAQNLVALEEVESIEGDLDALKEQLVGAETQVADSRRRLAETRLVAPVRAEVATRHIDVGDYLSTGTVAFDLIDVENLRVALPFPEYRAPQLRSGLAVRLSSSAVGGEPFLTEITDIRPSINPANRSVTVICDFTNPGSWRPGASARAEVVIETRAQVIVVPQTSVVRRPAGDVVYVLDGDIARERIVLRGQRVDGEVEIRDGLSGAERIVVDGAGFLTDGSTVSIVDQ